MIPDTHIDQRSWNWKACLVCDVRVYLFGLRYLYDMPLLVVSELRIHMKIITRVNATAKKKKLAKCNDVLRSDNIYFYILL